MTVTQNLRRQLLKNAAGRIFATAILLFWIGQALPPMIALAVDDVCHLSCCRGLASHTVGSCAGGTCHTKPQQKKATHDSMCEAKDLPDEEIAAKTGKNLSTSRDLPGVPVFDETQIADSHDTNHLPSLQIKIPEEFCQIICSVGASQNSNQQNSRSDVESAALISFAAKPRPPTADRIKFPVAAIIKFSQNISRNTPVRGPPSFFS